MSALERMKQSGVPVTPAVAAAVAAAPVVPLGQVPRVSAAAPVAPATSAAVAALRAKALGGVVPAPAAPAPAPVLELSTAATQALAQAHAVGFKDDPSLPTVHNIGGVPVHSLECKDGLFVAFFPDGSMSRRATSRAGAVECLRLTGLSTPAPAPAPAPAALPVGVTPAPAPAALPVGAAPAPAPAASKKRGRPPKAPPEVTAPLPAQEVAEVVSGVPVATLYIDVFPVSPGVYLRSVTAEIVEPARAAVEQEAGMDYRLIEFKGKQVLAAEVAERMANSPPVGEWVVMSKHVDNEVLQELVRAFCSRGCVFRGTI